MRNRLKSNKGLTLIELIATLIIVAIMSAVVFSRGSSTNDANQVSELDILKNHLRYAQLRALGDNADWKIDFQSGSYTLYNGDTSNPGGWILSPLPSDEGMGSSTHTLKEVTLTTYPTTISFNSWGVPTTGGTGSLSITLSGGKTITITSNTGFIP